MFVKEETSQIEQRVKGKYKDVEARLVVGRVPENPKTRPKFQKPEPNRNRKFRFLKNRTEPKPKSLTAGTRLATSVPSERLIHLTS